MKHSLAHRCKAAAEPSCCGLHSVLQLLRLHQLSAACWAQLPVQLRESLNWKAATYDCCRHVFLSQAKNEPLRAKSMHISQWEWMTRRRRSLGETEEYFHISPYWQTARYILTHQTTLWQRVKRELNTLKSNQIFSEPRATKCADLVWCLACGVLKENQFVWNQQKKTSPPK